MCLSYLVFLCVFILILQHLSYLTNLAIFAICTCFIFAYVHHLFVHIFPTNHSSQVAQHSHAQQPSLSFPLFIQTFLLAI